MGSGAGIKENLTGGSGIWISRIPGILVTPMTPFTWGRGWAWGRWELTCNMGLREQEIQTDRQTDTRFRGELLNTSVERRR